MTPIVFAGSGIIEGSAATLDAYFTAVQDPVDGSVRLRLLKGEHAIVAIAPSISPGAAQPLRGVASNTRH